MHDLLIPKCLILDDYAKSCKHSSWRCMMFWAVQSKLGGPVVVKLGFGPCKITCGFEGLCYLHLLMVI